MHSSRPARTVVSPALTLAELAFLVIIAAGCGDATKVKTFPARGQILVDDKPAEHAAVVFFPVSSDERLRTLAPRAKTDSAGFYELKTYWQGDGAPVGEFKVTVVWKGPLPANAGTEDFNPEVYEDRPDLLKGRYASPEKTPLRVTIDESGEVPRLELTTK